jgi:hypothetical protein
MMTGSRPGVIIAIHHRPLAAVKCLAVQLSDSFEQKGLR